MKIYINLIFCFLCFALSSTLFGQQKVEGEIRACKENPDAKGKYKILSIGQGIELQVDVAIEPRYRTEKNFIAIAVQFKEKYCQAEKLRITYFENKKQWQIIDPKEIEATPLAIYYYDRNKSEGIHIYKIVNGKVETRDLNISHSSEKEKSGTTRKSGGLMNVAGSKPITLVNLLGKD